MKESEPIMKIRFMLQKVFEKERNHELVEFVKNSVFRFETEPLYMGFPEETNLEIHVNPDIFIKYLDTWSQKQIIITATIKRLVNFEIRTIKILPDYEKLIVINKDIFPVKTEW